MRVGGYPMAILLLLLSNSGAATQTTSTAKPDWNKILQRCYATAKLEPSEESKKIARIARDDFYNFGGHRINSHGQLFSFGAVESEQEEDPDAIPNGNYRLRYLAWWNVLSYWRQLGERTLPIEAAKSYLRLQGYAAATTTRDDADTMRLGKLRVGKALAAIDAIPSSTLSDSEKEITKEAIIRAGLNDIAWSAAFISSVLRKAGIDKSRFSFSEAHRHYIYAAFKASLDEAASHSNSLRYRACPAGEVLPRLGDMVCYHREFAKLGSETTASQVRDLIALEVDVKDDDRTIVKSHCDIVAHYDESAKKIYVVGGNVQQAVTVKKLSLKDDYTFNESQPENCESDGTHWTLPGPSIGAPVAPHLKDSGKPDCSLNKKQWFVVLQARDDVGQKPVIIGRAN